MKVTTTALSANYKGKLVQRRVSSLEGTNFYCVATIVRLRVQTLVVDFKPTLLSCVGGFISKAIDFDVLHCLSLQLLVDHEIVRGLLLR